MVCIKDLFSDITDNQELSTQQIDLLLSDKKNVETLTNYNLIKDILTSNKGDIFLDSNFTNQVMSSIENIEINHEEQPIAPVIPKFFNKQKVIRFVSPLLQVGVAAAVFFSVVGSFNISTYFTEPAQNNIAKQQKVPNNTDFQLVGQHNQFNANKEVEIQKQQKDKIESIVEDYQLQRRIIPAQ